MTDTLFQDLAVALAPYGLSPRGGIVFDKDETVPEGPNGQPARSVLLVGNIGGEMWPHFASWRKRQAGGLSDPLDRWSAEVLGGIADQVGARAVFPSEKPYPPFQQWAMLAEGLKSSPIGILIHPEYGLWHAWRGALLFECEFVFEKPDAMTHPCDGCAEKPCLAACPASAVSLSAFDVEACRSLIMSSDGFACRETGCLSRNACPVGAEFRYTEEQQAFHQDAFLGLSEKKFDGCPRIAAFASSKG